MAFKIPREQTQDRQINKIQQNIAGVIEPIFFNLSGSFIATLTGCTTAPQGTVTWQRSTAEGPVTMQFPTITGISNTTSAQLGGLPVNLWPASEQVVFIQSEDNSVDQISVAFIQPTGVIQLSNALGGGLNSFTASGGKGILQGTITYQMAA